MSRLDHRCGRVFLAPSFRGVGLLLLVLFVAWPSAASAAEKETAAEAVAKLERALDSEDSSWEHLYELYDQARQAMSASKGADKDAAEAAYAAIRPRVAKALERDHVPLNGWFLGIFAALLLWGGFAWCLRLAMKSTPKHDLDEDETWPIRPEEP